MEVRAGEEGSHLESKSVLNTTAYEPFPEERRFQNSSDFVPSILPVSFPL